MIVPFHVFVKDVRRLWPVIALSLIMQIWLASLDARRGDRAADVSESLLNLMLPTVWVLLIGAVVHQDAIARDDAFWLTRPIPRWALATSKALFLFCVVHLTYLAACVYIVLSRGLDILPSIPALLGRQLLIAAAVTLPAWALAAITKNLLQFLSSSLLASGAALLFWFADSIQRVPWNPREDLAELTAAATILMLGAIGVLVLQYSWRRTIVARFITAGLVLFASTAYRYYPRVFADVGDRQSPSEAISLKAALNPDLGAMRGPATLGRSYTFRIEPVRWFEHEEFALNARKLTIQAQGQRKIDTTSFPLNPGDLGRGVHGGLTVAKQGGFLTLWIPSRLARELGGQSLTLQARAAMERWRQEEAGTLKISDQGTQVPGVGICRASEVAVYTEWAIRVSCESTEDTLTSVPVELRSKETNRSLRSGLGSATQHSRYPTWTWLSPVRRAATYFHIQSDPKIVAQLTWMLRPSDVAEASIQIYRYVDRVRQSTDVTIENVVLPQ